MSYIGENLLKGEVVTYRAGLHWLRFFRPEAFFTLFLAPFIAGKTPLLKVTNQCR